MNPGHLPLRDVLLDHRQQTLHVTSFLAIYNKNLNAGVSSGMFSHGHVILEEVMYGCNAGGANVETPFIDVRACIDL